MLNNLKSVKMKIKGFCFLIFMLSVATLSAQTLSPTRATDWSRAGHQGSFLEPDTTINFITAGGFNNGTTPNDSLLSAIFSSLGGVPAIIYFPAGNYLFTRTININQSVILRGKSSDSTTFTFNFPVESNLIYVYGNSTAVETTVAADLVKDSTRLPVSNAALFSQGNLIHLWENDSVLITSTWAMHTTGQIALIDTIINNDIYIGSPLRRNFYISRNTKITKLNPVQNVGIEKIKILPTNATVAQTSNIVFQYAYNCWIKCIQSINCNYSHVEARSSSNIVITGSYFQDAYSYGDGGKGYGIMIHSTSGECLVMDNIFKHLRHSMIFQSGANGNVFAYNYSREPYWTDVTLPSNSAGDMVLHGNYPYANLFEGNIGQNIVIDDSHGKNGSFNTYFRNRAELYGIFMNTNPASDEVNFIGNEIPNTGFLLGLYTIFGNNHFQYGNNVRGSITPAGTSLLPEASLFLNFALTYYQSNSHWPPIGTPNSMNAYKNEAQNRYIAGQLTDCLTDEIIVNTEDISIEPRVGLFPNPALNTMNITTPTGLIIENIQLISATGQVNHCARTENELDISNLQPGLYFILISFNNGSSIAKKFVKN